MLCVLVTGDRNYKDFDLVEQAILSTQKTMGDIVVIHGAASGADSLAEQVCKKHQIPYHGYPARWNKYGKAAGPKRNQLVLDLYDIYCVLAFHDRLENSKGTKDMVERAMNKSLSVFLYRKGEVICMTQMDMFND